MVSNCGGEWSAATTSDIKRIKTSRYTRASGDGGGGLLVLLHRGTFLRATTAFRIIGSTVKIRRRSEKRAKNKGSPCVLSINNILSSLPSTDPGPCAPAH